MGEHFIAGYCNECLTFCAPGKLCARPTCLSAIVRLKIETFDGTFHSRSS